MTKFIQETPKKIITIELKQDDITLTEMLEEYKYFLQAISYVIDPYKEAIFVREDDVVLSSKEFAELVAEKDKNGKNKCK